MFQVQLFLLIIKSRMSNTSLVTKFSCLQNPASSLFSPMDC